MLGWVEEGIFLVPCPDQSLDCLKNKGSPVIQPLLNNDIDIGLLPSFGGRQPWKCALNEEVVEVVEVVASGIILQRSTIWITT